MIIYEVNKNTPFKMMGSLVDAIDYFITIHEVNKDITLVMLNSSIEYKEKLLAFIRNRYDLSSTQFSSLFKNIQVMSYENIRVSVANRVLLLDYYTVRMLYDYCPIVYKKLYIIVENGSEKVFKKAKFYTEIPEIFDVDGSKPYIMKMRLDIVKKPKIVKNLVYVNHRPDPSNSHPRDRYKKEHEAVTQEMNEMFGDNWFFKKDSPVDNLFEEFNTFVYYKSSDWFDTHPRLFVECAYFNKEIIYINKENTKDGSWYRYNDLLSNGIKHRMLDTSDEIVKEFYAN